MIMKTLFTNEGRACFKLGLKIAVIDFFVAMGLLTILVVTGYSDEAKEMMSGIPDIVGLFLEAFCLIIAFSLWLAKTAIDAANEPYGLFSYDENGKLRFRGYSKEERQRVKDERRKEK